MAMNPAAKDSNNFASSNLSGGVADNAILGVTQNQPIPQGPQPTQASTPMAQQNNNAMGPQYWGIMSGGAGAQTPDYASQVAAHNAQMLQQMQAQFQPAAQAPQTFYGVGPNNELQVGDQVVPMGDNPTSAAQLIQNSPGQGVNPQNLKPGFRPVAASDVQQYLAGINRGFGHAVTETGKQFLGGVAGGGLDVAGRAAQWAGADNLGAGLIGAGKAADSFLGTDQPADTLGHGAIGKGFIENGRAAGMAVPIMAANVGLTAAGAPEAAAALDIGVVAPLFGAADAQQTQQQVLQQGGTPDQANAAGWRQFFISGGTQAALAGVGGKVMAGGGYTLVTKLKQAVQGGAMTAEQAAAIVTKPALLQRFAANEGVNLGVQSAGMGAQSAMSAANMNSAMPNGPQQSVGEAGLEGAKSGLFMGAMMAPVSAVHQFKDSAQRAAMGQALNTPTQQVDLLGALRQQQVAKDITPQVANLAGEAPAKQWAADTTNKAFNAADANQFGRDQADVAAAHPENFVAPEQPKPAAAPTPAAPVATAEQELQAQKGDDIMKVLGIGKKKQALVRPVIDDAVAAGVNLEDEASEPLVKLMKAGRMAAAAVELERLKGARDGSNTGPADGGVPPNGPVGADVGAGGVGAGAPVPVAGEPARRVDSAPATPAAGGEPPVASGTGLPGKNAVKFEPKAEIPDFSLTSSGAPSQAWQAAQPKEAPAPHPTDNMRPNLGKETGQKQLFPLGARGEIPKTPKRPVLPKDLAPVQAAVNQGVPIEQSKETMPQVKETLTDAKRSRKRQEESKAAEDAKNDEQKSAEAKAEDVTVPEDKWNAAFGDTHGERIHRALSGESFPEIAADHGVGEDAVRKSVARASAESIDKAVEAGKVDALTGADMKRQLEKAQQGVAVRKTAAEANKEGGSTISAHEDATPEQVKEVVSQANVGIQGTPKPDPTAGKLSTKEARVTKDAAFWEEQRKNNAGPKGDGAKYDEAVAKLKELAAVWGKKRTSATDEEKLSALDDQIAKATKKDGFAPKKLVEQRDKLREKLEAAAEPTEEASPHADQEEWTDHTGEYGSDDQASKSGPDAVDAPDSQRMDTDLRKLQDKGDFRGVIQYAMGNETNPIRKRVLEMVLGRYDDLKKLGFDFSFKVTKPGYELPGMAGVSRHFPGELGKATRMEVILNGADNGRSAGTNQETLAHELIHSVTQAAISSQPDGTAARKLQAFYSELRKDVLERKVKGELNDFEKRFFLGTNNTLENAHELLAWGLTNPKMQEYLADRMDSQGRTWYSRLLDVVARALGINKVDERSDLARLMSVSDELFHESTDPYTKEANGRLMSFGKQEHEGDNSVFALRNKKDGMEIAYDKDGLVLYRAKDVRGREIFVPGKEGVGVADRDVENFTGHQIPAEDLAKLKAVANTLRSTDAAMVQKNIDKLPERYQEPVRNATDALGRWGSSALTHVTFTRDLVKKGIEMGIHSLERYEKLRESQEAMSGKFRRMAIDAIEDVKNFHQGEKESLTDFLQHSTLNKEWGYGYKARGKAKEMYDALSPRAQKVARQVFEHGTEMLKAKKEAINKLADDTYGSMIKEARDAGNESLVNDIEGDRKTMLAKYASLMDISEGDPYTSARRQGDWVVVGKSEDFLKAEHDAASEDLRTAKDGQAERMKLIDDPKHYMVHEAESPAEARALMKNMQEKLGFPDGVDNTYYHPKDPWKAKLDGGQGVLAGMARLRSQLDSLHGEARTPEDKAKYETSRKLLTNMWLDALGTASARKSELRRLGVNGQMDMIKAFRLQSTADAHFVSGIYHNAKMLDALKAANKEAKAGGVSSEERTERMGLYDEFMRRHDLSMNAPPTPVFNKIAQYTALWQIATSPGHYLGNLMQPWAMTLPLLQARHGYANASKEFFKAYGEIGDILAKTGVLNSLKVSDMPADVREAMSRLLELGRLDIGMNTEYGSLELKEKNPVSKAMQGVVDRIRQASLKMESLNRLASAASAYRLEMARTGDHEHSLHYAADVVADTHGDYSSSNAPRMFNSGLGKMALQFRKFQLVQLTYMAKLIGGLKDADPETRVMAQRALAFTLGHVAVLGGALAMPGFGTLSAASQILTRLATGVEGEDLEIKLEKMVGDRNLAQLLLRGVPGLAGVDATKKVGFGDLASIMPMADVDPTKATSVQEGLGAVLSGPFGGLLERGATALGNMQRGNWYRGVEGLAPEGVMNVMKAARTSGAMEGFGVKGGVTNTKGDKLMDVSAANAFVQALGFTPSAQAMQSAETGAMAKSTEAFKDRLDILKARYTNAARSGGDVSGAVKELNNLRAEMIDRGFRPTPLGAILKAPVEQLKREMFTTAGGVQYNPKQTGRAVSELPK